MGAKKDETHERILRAAAGSVRARGYDGVSVAEVMKEAGLTHGGFYAHFPSREALLAEAMDVAAAESIANLTRAAASDEPLDRVIDAYLGDRHVAAPEKGCLLAALGTETRRQGAAVRRVATRATKELVDLVARLGPAWGKPGGHEEALGVVACLVGAVVIARAADDPALSRDVRKAARRLARSRRPRENV